MSAPLARCPGCRRTFRLDAASPWRPFCSERCRLIDLGAWITERHAIPGEAVPPESEPAPEPGKSP